MLENIKHQILSIIFQYLKRESTSVFLFGSCAERTSTKHSDIDIGIMSDNKISDATFIQIAHELNQKVYTLRKIDLVDFDNIDKTFANFAMRNIKIWHSAKNLEGKSRIWKRLSQN